MKKLIFDMDGTLLDTMGMWDNFMKLYSDFDKNNIDKSFIPQVSESSSLSYSVQLVKDYQEVFVSDKEIAQQIHAFLYDFYSSRDRAKLDVKRVIRRLYEKGYELYLATATDFAYAYQGLRAANLHGYFTDIFTPDMIGSKKHELDYYEKLSMYIGIKEGDAIFIDDASYALALAKNQGYATIGVYDSHSPENSLVEKIGDFYIRDFGELEKILRRIERGDKRTLDKIKDKEDEEII